MNKKPLFSGQNKHPGNEQWLEEIETTQAQEGWKDELLSRVRAVLGKHGSEISKVGYKINETQIQYESPINAMFSFKPLKVMWVQYNTYDPFTKKPGTRTVRYGPETASLMVLVKNPKPDGSFDWYLLARKKYQIAIQSHSVEFSRGWVPDETKDSNMGWYLFDRDFPGFRVNGVGADFVKSIYCTSITQPVWENTGEANDHISQHLIIVTLNRHLGKNELKEILVKECLKKEYLDKPGYFDLNKLDHNDLTSEPMIYDLVEAAKFLNTSFSEKKTDENSSVLNEKFSCFCWNSFLSSFGWQFPEIMPEKRVLPA